MLNRSQAAVSGAHSSQKRSTTWAIVLRVLFFLGLALALTQSLLANPAPAGSTIVTVTNDSGAGSLRQAILNANESNAPVTISFNIPGSGLFIINLLSQLPAVTNSVVIDGTTQPGYAGTPVIELNGTVAGANVNGLYLSGGNSMVTGLAIGGFTGAGIVLDVAGGNLITGNFIGTDTTGTANLGNGSTGIFINAGDGNWVGGNSASTGNVIAFNGGAGVAILSGTNNLVRGNSIFSNAGLAIDLGATASPLANDDGDTDSGANNLQNYPVLAGFSATGSATTIRGNLNSTSNTTFQIDFYFSPALTNSGDAKSYLGSIGVTTDDNGNAAFHPTFPLTVPMNSFVTATATDPAGNTSEFSPAVQFTPTNVVNLSLSVTAASNVVVGDQFVLSLTLTNSGTNMANNVVLTDLLPDSLSYVYSVATLGVSANTNGVLTWCAGSIPAGGSTTLTIYTLAETVGTVANSASFTQNEFNINGSQSSATPVDVFVPAAPVITSQPPGLLQSVVGSLLNLVVTVTSHSNPSYQWRLNGKNIPGATNALLSILSILPINGGTYTCIVQDDYGVTSTQPILLTISGILSPTPGNNFANRTSVGLLQGLGLGLVQDVCNNINATSEPGEPLHAGVPGGKSVWYTWTSPPSILGLGGKGIVTLSTTGSSFDTLLAVYTGNSLTNLTPVASDDDAGGYYTSQVQFNVTPSTTYNIAIDGAYGASGQIVLTLSYDSGKGVMPVINTQPVNQIVAPNSPASFSVAASGSGLHYQWMFNDTAIPNATTSSLLVKNASAASVGLYSVCVSNSAGTAISRYASLQTSVLDGGVNTNTLSLDKFQTAYTAEQIGLGLLNLNLSQIRVDAFDNTRPTDGGGTSRGYSSTQVFSTYGGGTQTGEPSSCNNMGGNSAWTSLQAADNGVLTIDTDGSSFKTILAVYTGNANNFSSLTQVACNIGGGKNGTTSKVSFAATSNTVYYVAVDGVNGAHGTVVLNWSLAVPPTITAQPASQTVAAGSTVTLVANATGHLTPVAQWFCNGTLVAGATNGTLVISNFQASTVGTYMMIATNSVGAAITTPATILLNSVLHLDSFHFNSVSHSCQMRLVGTANTSYYIQASSDMRNWTTIATNTSSTGLWNFSETISNNIPQRYYRAIPGH